MTRHSRPATTILLSLLAQSVDAAVIQVPADQPTIASAMLAAAPGDEIVVAPGVYSHGAQPLISSGFSGGVDLVIRSSDGPGVTVLDGLGTARLVELYSKESTSFVIEGFTMRNGAFPTNWGGAMLLWNASPTVRNCVFELNIADYGGAVANYEGGNGVFESCEFRNNTGVIGGAVASLNSFPRFVDCVFEDNLADDPTIYNEGGGAWDGGGVGRYERCVFRNNTAQTGGGVFGKGATTGIELIDCILEGNTTTTSTGAGVAAVGGTVVHAVNTRFLGNVSQTWGAGAFVQQSPGSSFVNCEFSGNRCTTRNGAGVYASHDSIIEVRNSTFANNAASSTVGGGFSAVVNCTVTIANSLFWGNTGASSSPAPTMDENDQIHVTTPLSFTIDHSIVQNLATLAGTSLTDEDPLFSDARGPDGIAGTIDDDLRLSSASPAIDAGDNLMVGADAFDLDADTDLVESIPFDISGEDRLIDDLATTDTGSGAAPIVDLGAHETPSGAIPCPSDMSGDGLTDGADLGLLLGSWGAPGASDLNGDGVTDGSDLGLLLGAWGACP
ncbi:MAG: right-handed parallel beta-helix repeat-containing protein [Phycisphaerales bacterium JB043]